MKQISILSFILAVVHFANAGFLFGIKSSSSKAEEVIWHSFLNIGAAVSDFTGTDKTLSTSNTTLSQYLHPKITLDRHSATCQFDAAPVNCVVDMNAGRPLIELPKMVRGDKIFVFDYLVTAETARGESLVMN